MDSTAEGARKKVERALNSLVKNLGGWKAYRDEETQESSKTAGQEPVNPSHE
jgi:hypothetical protein